MEVFSLEEDDVSGMFITQEPKCSQVEKEELECDEDELFCGAKHSDFQLPYVSGVKPNGLEGAQYSDISDDDFEITSSQMP